MIDRSFKICNNSNPHHNDIEKIKSNLFKNVHPPFLIDKVMKKYLDYKFSSDQNQLKDNSDVHYFKLPYIGNLSHHSKNKLLKLCKEFCKKHFNFECFLIHSKLKTILQIKTQFLTSWIYKFTCVSCSSNYNGESCCHFKTRIEEHIKKDNKCHIFKHLNSSTTWFN